MGRRDRERRERIQVGIEDPRSPTPRQKSLLCGVCHRLVPENEARQHMRDCWKVKVKDKDPIPAQVPDKVWQRLAKAAAQDAKGEVVRPV